MGIEGAVISQPSRLSPDQLGRPGAGDPGNRASRDEAALKGDPLAAG